MKTTFYYVQAEFYGLGGSKAFVGIKEAKAMPENKYRAVMA